MRKKLLVNFPLIRAVIFDFGRVISAQKPVSLFRAYEQDLGLAPDTINQIMFESQAWQDALVGRISAKEFWHAIGPALGLESREMIDDFRKRYHADESIDTGVVRLIQRLRGRYKLAVLSNSPPGLAEWLSAWEIFDLFDVVYCSGDEGMIKPDPAAYNSILNRLDILPREAIFIDDTTGHVKAAQSLGIHGIRFTNARQLKLDLDSLLTLQKNARLERMSIIEKSYTVESETLDSVFAHWQQADSFLPWNCLFVLPVWLKPWWDNLGRNAALYLLSIRHEGRTIGIAPLQRRDDTVRLLGDENVCDNLDFIVVPEKSAEFYRILINYLKQDGVKRMELAPVRQDSSVMAQLLPVAEKTGCRISYEGNDISFELDLPGSWDDYLRYFKRQRTA